MAALPKPAKLRPTPVPVSRMAGRKSAAYEGCSPTLRAKRSAPAAKISPPGKATNALAEAIGEPATDRRGQGGHQRAGG
jgi:hypothetical protein